MKKVVLFAVCLFYTLLLIGQAPESFNYQAVVRDSDGAPIKGQMVSIQIQILKDNESGTSVYSETHQKQTTSLGVLNLKIGTGEDKTGDLTLLDWSASAYYLNVAIDMDGGDDYQTLGTTQILSVPYALYSKESNNALHAIYADSSQFSIKSDTSIYSNHALVSDTAYIASKLNEDVLYFTNSDTLFAIKDRIGKIVFAVFNDGVKVYVNEGVKGNVGGFAVSGRGTGKATEYSVLNITPDSARFYLNDAIKGTPGGFAVSGRGTGKSPNSEYFNISASTLSNADTITSSQPRMLWYPKSEAFLVGRVLVEHPDSVGLNSFATGYESKAIGGFSHALGYKSIARSNYSTAIGKNALAEGESSYSIGDMSMTVGLNSYAIGRNVVTKGNGSYAMGNGAIATGTGSFSFGAGGRDSAGVALPITTESVGMNSFALGLGAKSYGINSFSIGTGTTTTEAGENAFAIGFGSVASGRYAVAMGYMNTSSGVSSMTWGGVRSGTTNYPNLASGKASTAWGFKTVASGSNATSWGSSTLASGWNASTWGDNTIAEGYCATAWGKGSKAIKTYTTAWLGGFAKGYHTTAVGEGIVANSYKSFVFGRANDTIYNHSEISYYDGVSPSSYIGWYDDDPLFVIGNGQDHPAVGKRNALTILKDATTIIGWDITVKSDASNPDTAYVRSVKVPRDAGFRFYVHGSAGGTNSWNSTSDLRLKQNVQSIDGALDKVLKLRGVFFEWKDPQRKGKNIGFIAQETKDVLPEVVTGSEETQYSMQYAPITALLVEALKEENKKVDNLEKQIENLQQQINELKILINDK